MNVNRTTIALRSLTRTLTRSFLSLRLEMKDGAAQEFGPNTIKRVSIKK